MIMIMIIELFYPATLSTTTQRRSRLQHGYCIGVSRRSAQAAASEVLAQGPYVATRAVEGHRLFQSTTTPTVGCHITA